MRKRAENNKLTRMWEWRSKFYTIAAPTRKTTTTTTKKSRRGDYNFRQKITKGVDDIENSLSHQIPTRTMRCSRKRTFNSMYNILQRFENTSILNRLRIENDGVESPRFPFRSPFFDRVHLLLRVIRCGKLFQRNLLKMIRTFSTNAYTRLSRVNWRDIIGHANGCEPKYRQKWCRPRTESKVLQNLDSVPGSKSRSLKLSF